MTQDGGLCRKMIRKSISNSVNKSERSWATRPSPMGGKLARRGAPSQPPLHASQPDRYRIDPFIQGGEGILQTRSQQLKRKSCLWFATLDPRCLRTRFKLPDHPSSVDLTSTNISELGKKVWCLIHATERKKEVGGDSSSWSALKKQGEAVTIQM